MVRCVVIGCEGKTRQISLHGNPKDPYLSEIWKNTITRWNNGHKLSKHYCVCSRHFRPENVLVRFGQTRLVRDSIPTIWKVASYCQILNKDETLEDENAFEDVEYLDSDIEESPCVTGGDAICFVKVEPHYTELDDTTNERIKIEETSDADDTTKPPDSGEATQPTKMCAPRTVVKPLLNQSNVMLTNFRGCKAKIRKFRRTIISLKAINRRYIHRKQLLRKTLDELREELSASDRSLLKLQEDIEVESEYWS